MGCCGGGGEPVREREASRTPSETLPADEPLQILKLRLAKGEITLEEYERLVAILRI